MNIKCSPTLDGCACFFSIRMVTHIALAFVWSIFSCLALIGDRLKYGWIVTTALVLLVSLIGTIVFALDVGEALVS